MSSYIGISSTYLFLLYSVSTCSDNERTDEDLPNSQEETRSECPRVKDGSFRWVKGWSSRCWGCLDQFSMLSLLIHQMNLEHIHVPGTMLNFSMDHWFHFHSNLMKWY